MTEQGFKELQHEQQQSGMGLMAYLKSHSICYSNYTYWRKKYSATVVGDAQQPQTMAPISVRNTSNQQDAREGISVSLPNGTLAFFSPGMESSAIRLLMEMGGAYVQP